MNPQTLSFVHRQYTKIESKNKLKFAAMIKQHMVLNNNGLEWWRLCYTPPEPCLTSHYKLTVWVHCDASKLACRGVTKYSLCEFSCEIIPDWEFSLLVRVEEGRVAQTFAFRPKSMKETVLVKLGPKRRWMFTRLSNHCNFWGMNVH